MDAVSLPPRADSSRYIGGHGGRSRASTVYMEDCNVLNNTALSYAEGGGIFIADSDLVMVRCNVSGNSAEEEADEGGGIYIEGTAMLSLTDTEVSDNSAGVGGGLYATGGVDVQLSNVHMTGNVATENSDSNAWIRGSSTMVRCSAGQCIFGTQCQSCNAPVGPAPGIFPGTVSVTDYAGFRSALANAGTAQIVVSADLELDGSAGPITIGPRPVPLLISGNLPNGDRALVGNGWRMFTINDEDPPFQAGRPAANAGCFGGIFLFPPPLLSGTPARTNVSARPHPPTSCPCRSLTIT